MQITSKKLCGSAKFLFQRIGTALQHKRTSAPDHNLATARLKQNRLTRSGGALFIAKFWTKSEKLSERMNERFTQMSLNEQKTTRSSLTLRRNLQNEIISIRNRRTNARNQLKYT